MRKNRLLVNWACIKICYSLADHMQKFVTRWLSMRENNFGAPSGFQRFSSLPLCHQYLCLLFPSLLDVLCPLSHIFVLSLMSFGLCLPFYVPCLMYLFLGYRPLSPVLRLCSLYTVLYPLSHGSAPGLPSSVPCLTWSAPCLPSSFLRPLTPINCPICSWHFWWLATSWYCTYLYVWLVGSG
jgi:hypothetical protein